MNGVFDGAFFRLSCNFCKEPGHFAVDLVDYPLSVKDVKNYNDNSEQSEADRQGDTRGRAVGFSDIRGRDETHDKVRDRRNNSDKACVRKLRFNVVDMVALRARRSHDGGIGDRADVVAVNGAGKDCGHRQEEEPFVCRSGHDRGRNRDQHAERTPRRTGCKGNEARQDEEHERNDTDRHAVRRDIGLHERFGVQRTVDNVFYTVAFRTHDRAERPSKRQDENCRNHGLEAFGDGFHTAFERNGFRADIEDERDNEGDKRTHSKRAACVAVTERFEYVRRLKRSSDRFGVPVIEVSVEDHRAYAANDKGNDGENEVSDFPFYRLIHFDIFGGKVFFSGVQVARLNGDLFIPFHFEEIEFQQNGHDHKSDGKQGVHIKRNGFDKRHDTAVGVSGNSRRPRRNGGDDTDRSSRCVDQIRQFGVADLMFVGDGAHCVPYRQAVEVVVYEDKRAESDGGELRAVTGFDLSACPFAVCFATAGFDHKNGEDTENDQEDKNSTVSAELFRHRDEQIGNGFERISAGKEHGSRKDTGKKAEVHLFGDERKNDRDNRRDECPESTDKVIARCADER